MFLFLLRFRLVNLGRFPLTPQVDLAFRLAFTLNFKPLIKSTVKGQGAYFENTLSDWLATDYIVIASFNRDVVTLVLDIEVPELALPLRGLALVLSDSGFPLLLTALHNDERVHLANFVNIVIELGLNQVNPQLSERHIFS